MSKIKIDPVSILSASIFALGAVVSVLTNKKNSMEMETMKKEILDELIQKK